MGYFSRNEERLVRMEEQQNSLATEYVSTNALLQRIMEQLVHSEELIRELQEQQKRLVARQKETGETQNDFRSALENHLSLQDSCLNDLREYLQSQDELLTRQSDLLEQLSTRLCQLEAQGEKQAEINASELENLDLLKKRQIRHRDELHRHIDFTYRDLMVVSRGLSAYWGKQAVLETEYPVAINSIDHQVPKGTAYDDTRYPRFVKRCEDLFLKDEEQSLSFLDLGCSGGGMVLEALLRGHYALGLEGSDYSLIRQRAEWRLIPEHLKTCDITKPFRLIDPETNGPMLFDVVTAWEVMEHIPEEDVPQLIENISDCLQDGGYFIASIASKPDPDPVSGVDYHVNLNRIDWWQAAFEEHGFVLENDLFTLYDLARGRYNQNVCWRDPRNPDKSDPEKEFHIVARKISAALEPSG